MTATELDVDRTLELARCAREPSEVDEQRVLDALRSRIVDAPELLGGRGDFVVKPNQGSAGRGVLVVTGRMEGHYRRHNGERLTQDHLRQHLSDILSGMYSLGGRADRAIVQQRIRLHPAFQAVTYQGIPDVRVILYRNEPAMAMLRLPTRSSGGRANLHQGGIGAGVDLGTGATVHAVQRNRSVRAHPDTGADLVGVRVPYWKEILVLSRQVAWAAGHAKGRSSGRRIGGGRSGWVRRRRWWRWGIRSWG